jgi:3',5'-cyclic-AMP phosphodiesterase
VRFVLFTDQHFGPEARFRGKLRKLSHEAGRLTRELVARCNDDLVPDLVVNLGDVLEDESPERDRAAYGEFISLLAPLRAPVIHVAGNHDTVHLTAPELAELWGESGALHRSRDVAGVHFAVLHSQETKDVGVRLPNEQLEWLGADLASTHLPTVVLVHHPLSDCDLGGNRWFEAAPQLCRVVERREFRRVIAASGKVRAVFNGHAHWNHFDLCEGIPYVTLQSLTENLDDDAPGRPAAAYAVVDLKEKRLSVTVGGAEEVRYQVDG